MQWMLSDAMVVFSDAMIVLSDAIDVLSEVTSWRGRPDNAVAVYQLQ